MTGQEYGEIAAACDRLLRADDTSLARVAIPALHLINEHPGCIAQYEGLTGAPDVSGQGRRRAPVAVSCSAWVPRAGQALVRSFERPAETWTPAMWPGGVDVLIVSRAANPAQLDSDEDFYFGSLQSSLWKRGATSAIVFVNHLPLDYASGGNELHSAPAARLLLPQTVSFARETQIWRQCGMASVKLRLAARRSNNPLDSVIAALASRHAVFGGTAANLRLQGLISDMCHRLNPRIVLTTYEGTASERMIWHAARRNGRRPLCVGYQHTRMLKRAHAIRRPVGARGIDCDPDVILTLGRTPHALFTECAELGSVRLIEYGSHRRVESGELRPIGERPRQCLVLPDADESEQAHLFEFALACARLAPAVTFVLRPHPIVSRNGSRAYCPEPRELPGNVTLSEGEALEQDCARSRYCLYRGSSAAIHAILAGVKPFYVARSGELPFDPLFALSDWRETVTSPGDFADRMRAADASTDMSAASRAWSVYDRYVSRVRPEALDELLEMVAHREFAK